ncbi:hypothetical protein LTS10_003788 [Elasticomyces elasticus]|nr:hypothetical protein LTS10_003788 [Elasticomyces elasticus]
MNKYCLHCEKTHTYCAGTQRASTTRTSRYQQQHRQPLQPIVLTPATIVRRMTSKIKAQPSSRFWKLITENSDEMETTGADEQSSRFLSLPRELGDHIYEYTLSLQNPTVYQIQDKKTDPCDIALKSDKCFYRGVFQDRKCLALLSVNKQIYRETAKLFFSCNHFEVQAWVPGREDIFDLETEVPRCSMSALYMFLQKIALVDGKAPIHITFDFGNIDVNSVLYARPDTVSVMRRILEDLRSVNSRDPRIRLTASMTIDIDIDRGYEQYGNYESYSFRASISDPLPGISAFIAQLGKTIADNEVTLYTNEVVVIHDAEDLEGMDIFFRELRRSMEESANRQLAPETAREGGIGQEKA